MSSYLIPLRQSFKMELGSKSGKRFSKSCPKKVPQDFQAPKIRKPFSIRQMDEKKTQPHGSFAGSPSNNEDETPFGQSRNLICNQKIARNIINWEAVGWGLHPTGGA